MDGGFVELRVLINGSLAFFHFRKEKIISRSVNNFDNHQQINEIRFYYFFELEGVISHPL